MKQCLQCGLTLLLPIFTCWMLSVGGQLTALSEGTMDLFFHLRGERDPGQQLVIVGIDEKSIAELGNWPFPRTLHGRLLAQLTQARSVGFDLLFHTPDKTDPAFIQDLKAAGVPVVLAQAAGYDGTMLEPNHLQPVETVGTGRIETISSRDSTVRRVTLCPQGDASFAAAMTGLNCESSSSSELEWINFYGPAFTFLYLSYSDVLQGQFPASFFKDRYVLVGARALALGDSHRTPLADSFALPGVEIQATIISNLLDHSFIRTPRWIQPLFWLAVVLLVLFVWPAGRETANLLLGSGLLVLLWLTGYLAFRANIFANPAPASLLLLAAYPSHLFIQWLNTTWRLVREIKTLEQYLARSLDDAYVNLPPTLQPMHSKPQTSSSSPLKVGLERHLSGLHRSIATLNLQNAIIGRLLARETPPLALWAREDGRLLLINNKFKAIWSQSSHGESQPDLARFTELLNRQQVQDTTGSRPLEPAHLDIEESVDIEFIQAGARRYYRVVIQPVEDAPQDAAENAGSEPALGKLGSPCILASLTDITELRELERMRAEVMNIVSHELKLPLTTISGYAEMISDSGDQTQKPWADKILAQSNRLAAMIEDFLSITRIESGRYAVYSVPLNILDTLHDCISAISHAAESKDIQLKIELPRRTSPILGDESLLLQAVLNILDNGVKFSPAGSILELELVEFADHLRLRIGDNGPGIPEDERKLVFEKFVRGQGSNSNAIKGFGLGLSFVRQVIEAHRGSVEIDASSGGGCLVEIRLPKT